MQIKNKLQHPLSDSDNGQDHGPRILEEMALLEKLGAEFGWDKISAIIVVGKNDTAQ